MIRHIAVVVLSILFISCTGGNEDVMQIDEMGDLSRRYLFLELSMGRHDSGHVDAYFGPEAIKTEAEAALLSLDDVFAGSAALGMSLQAIDAPNDPMLTARIDGLMARLRALNTRIALNKGESIPFDDETAMLFGTVAPHNDAAKFDAVLSEIDALLPGDSRLSERIDNFLEQFVIPADKLSEVFDAAIAECRRRTLEFMVLPAGENFSVEYVTDKPWSGYNWYQGNATSLIQVNTDQPSHIDSAVRLGCHEGYPGHHVYNTLLEQNLVRGEGWLEFTLYPLFSPQSLIAEGSANYGINLAFPDNDRIEFEKTVLFPIAGLDESKADQFYKLQELKEQLSYAGNEAARRYLNGDIDREQAVRWLVKYSLMTQERAQQRTRFIDTYRSYVINYNHGKTMVTDYIERKTSSPAERWKKFERMLSTSVLPSDLEK